MATKKDQPLPVEGAGSILSTVSGPSTGAPPKALDKSNPSELLRKVVGTATLSAQMPSNPNKPGEYGDAARTPPEGVHLSPPAPVVTGSTVTETTASGKLGDGVPPQGNNATIGSLDRVRVDSGGQVLTTNQGVAIADLRAVLHRCRRTRFG